MAQKLSRRKLAMYAAERLLDGEERVIEEIVGLLVSEKRQREIDLLVRDIEREMAQRGTVVATVESARELTAKDRSSIESLIAGRNVQLRQIVDPSLIGGFKLTTPNGVLDATIIRKLNQLRAKKI